VTDGRARPTVATVRWCPGSLAGQRGLASSCQRCGGEAGQDGPTSAATLIAVMLGPRRSRGLRVQPVPDLGGSRSVGSRLLNAGERPTVGSDRKLDPNRKPIARAERWRWVWRLCAQLDGGPVCSAHNDADAADHLRETYVPERAAPVGGLHRSRELLRCAHRVGTWGRQWVKLAELLLVRSPRGVRGMSHHVAVWVRPPVGRKKSTSRLENCRSRSTGPALCQNPTS
jgi:hypothetical protein